MIFAEKNGIGFSADEAKTYYARLHTTSGKLSDKELDNVADGG